MYRRFGQDKVVVSVCSRGLSVRARPGIRYSPLMRVGALLTLARIGVTVISFGLYGIQLKTRWVTIDKREGSGNESDVPLAPEGLNVWELMKGEKIGARVIGIGSVSPEENLAL
ncbi:uncharacterized protein EV420DRAFT_1479684 [Desarmillaria tabescens]|uniref:Uncharacterized protein n=1 Tax=Armillaria tabescens TaxID=1929756 RepID=A0AA39N591_ARMTA|nr:uncharacterized protein EV420DRAFT_1479684 [Desarmillaria tabescens]KAK0458402.1 hypothetical protein EV420DRAFT_1479684 [Desarmillaria tabescens]